MTLWLLSMKCKLSFPFNGFVADGKDAPVNVGCEGLQIYFLRITQVVQTTKDQLGCEIDLS